MLHGKYAYYELNREEVDQDASLTWLLDGFLNRETEFFMAIQDGVIKTKNYQKYLEDSSVKDDRCRICDKPVETIEHKTSACEKMVTEEYNERHDTVAKIIQSAIARKSKLLGDETPY